MGANLAQLQCALAGRGSPVQRAQPDLQHTRGNALHVLSGGLTIAQAIRAERRNKISRFCLEQDFPEVDRQWV